MPRSTRDRHYAIKTRRQPVTVTQPRQDAPQAVRHQQLGEALDDDLVLTRGVGVYDHGPAHLRTVVVHGDGLDGARQGRQVQLFHTGRDGRQRWACSSRTSSHSRRRGTAAYDR